MSQNRKRGRRRKSPDEILLQYCSQLNEDDRVDPREYFRNPRQSSRRKTMQLCRQVSQVLSLSMGELSDSDLQGLQIMSVQPAPNSAQLLVILELQLSAATDAETVWATIASIREKLGMVEGKLRTDVAQAIHRKRAPRLLFEILSQSVGPGKPTAEHFVNRFEAPRRDGGKSEAD